MIIEHESLTFADNCNVCHIVRHMNCTVLLYSERPKKKLWQDAGKWDHDKFNLNDQAPKSREELIAIYGYDIRSSDKPPEMQKRRPRYSIVVDFTSLLVLASLFQA